MLRNVLQSRNPLLPFKGHSNLFIFGVCTDWRITYSSFIFEEGFVVLIVLVLRHIEMWSWIGLFTAPTRDTRLRYTENGDWPSHKRRSDTIKGWRFEKQISQGTSYIVVTNVRRQVLKMRIYKEERSINIIKGFRGIVSHPGLSLSLYKRLSRLSVFKFLVPQPSWCEGDFRGPLLGRKEEGRRPTRSGGNQTPMYTRDRQTRK